MKPDAWSYTHSRIYVDGSTPGLTCTVSMPTCYAGAEAVLTRLRDDLAAPDVTGAFALSTTPLFGQDMRPVDGTVFSIVRSDGHGILVGSPCPSAGAGSCTPIPASVQQLVDDLQYLDRQMLELQPPQSTACAVFRQSTAATVSCNYPACYANLISGCIRQGACVAQDGYLCADQQPCPEPVTTVPPTAIATTSNLCYANGVKILSSTSSVDSAYPISVVVRKNGTLCYTYKVTSSAGVREYRNSAGAIVATYTPNASRDSTVTITCTDDGSSAVVSLNCDVDADAGTTDQCTRNGVCTE